MLSFVESPDIEASKGLATMDKFMLDFAEDTMLSDIPRHLLMFRFRSVRLFSVILRIGLAITLDDGYYLGIPAWVAFAC